MRSRKPCANWGGHLAILSIDPFGAFQSGTPSNRNGPIAVLTPGWTELCVARGVPRLADER